MEPGVVPPGARGLEAGIFAFLDYSVLRQEPTAVTFCATARRPKGAAQLAQRPLWVLVSCQSFSASLARRDPWQIEPDDASVHWLGTRQSGRGKKVDRLSGRSIVPWGASPN
jgi:hypothetical protein